MDTTLLPSLPLKEKSKVQAVEDHIENQQRILQILKDNLTMAQNRMKQQVDQHRSERSFEVGDWVFLRLQPYKQMSLKQAKKVGEMVFPILGHNCKVILVNFYDFLYKVPEGKVHCSLKSGTSIHKTKRHS
jgi:septum formation inhibitor MinC